MVSDPISRAYLTPPVKVRQTSAPHISPEPGRFDRLALILGGAAKKVLRAAAVDDAWDEDLDQVRRLLTLDERT